MLRARAGGGLDGEAERPAGPPPDACAEAGPCRPLAARGGALQRPVSLVWLRRDLRLDDNPALTAALKTGGNVVVVYIWSPEEEGQFQPGRCNRWWLHNSLKALSVSLRKLGSRLVLRSARQSHAALLELVVETGAQAVFFNHLYDPVSLVRDNGVKQALKGMGVACDTFNADLLYEPWEIYSDADGRPFTSFEPFWAKLLAMLYEPDLPALAPKALPPPPAPLRSASLEELGLMSPDEAPSNDVLGRKWTPGEEAARVALDDFLAERLKEYAGARALSDTAGTSQLSPYLHFGEISVRRVWYQTKQMEWLWAQSGLASHSVAAFQRALGLREYGRYLSFHFPFTHERALLEHLRPFPWRYHAGDFKAWRQGATGYPLVDAGMRQLWATGWLHNRVRRVVATFLVKHLLLPWQWGLKHYWDTLLDADLESDVLGWQFVSGGLPDSPPFGALESIEDEARRYDPHGHFVRRWVPQLARVPTEWIHAPWKAPQSVLDASGVEIGTNYPAPIVQPAESQARLDAALGALAAARGPGALAEEAAAAAAAAAPAPGVLAPPPPALFAFADEPPAEAQQAQHVPMEPPPAQAAPAAVRPPRVHCAAASGEATGATGDVAAPSGAPAGPRMLATVLLAATRRGDSSSGSASPRLRAAGGAGPLPPARRPSRGSRGGAMSSGAAGSEPVSGTLAGLEAVAAATAAAHASMAAQHAAATALVAAPPQGLPKRKRSSAADLRAVAEDALSH